MSVRLPAFYLSHGGGPCFWMEMPEPFGAHGFDKLRDFLAQILPALPERPKALLVISAHWEEDRPTVTTTRVPSMLFDYYGFPAHTYQLSYPAAGDPLLAQRVQELLTQAGIQAGTDAARGFDHGVFVPLLIMNPAADIPVVCLSLQKGLDPARHVAIGAALESLRDEGVLIIGSGNSYHNLRRFFDGEPREAALFDAWLTKVVTDPSVEDRNARLMAWEKAPFARSCHPREEHLLPLMVVVGAGGRDQGRQVFNDAIGGKAISGYGFGLIV